MPLSGKTITQLWRDPLQTILYRLGISDDHQAAIFTKEACFKYILYRMSRRVWPHRPFSKGLFESSPDSKYDYEYLIDFDDSDVRRWRHEAKRGVSVPRELQRHGMLYAPDKKVLFLR
jgi:hypothetical protein